MSEKATREIQSYTLNKSFFIFAVKKTERISRAVYLITNFFPENEPLRWRLREEALALLDHFAHVADSSATNGSIDLSFIKRSLELSLASLGIAHSAGLISEMNFSILKNEYEKLLRSLIQELESDGMHSPLAFPDDFFGVDRELDGKSGGQKYLYSGAFDTSRRITEEVRGAHIPQLRKEEKQILPKEEKVTELYKRQKDIIKDIKDTNTETVSQQKDTITDKVEKTDTKQQVSRTNRKDVIIQLVKDMKEVTVKDVSKEIQGVSEKTLQREINTLVDSGVLERVGARRWSRYRFA